MLTSNAARLSGVSVMYRTSSSRSPPSTVSLSFLTGRKLRVQKGHVGPCRGTRRGYARHACGGPRRRGSFPLIPQSVTARTVAAVAQSAARPQRREQWRFQRIAWITGLPRCVAGRCSSCDGTVRAGVPYSVDASPSAAFAAVLTYRRCGSLSSSTGWRSSGCSSKIRFAGAGIMRSPCRRRARPIALPAGHAPLAMPMRSSARRCN